LRFLENIHKPLFINVNDNIEGSVEHSQYINTKNPFSIMHIHF